MVQTRAGAIGWNKKKKASRFICIIIIYVTVSEKTSPLSQN